MEAHDLDGALACLMEAADALAELHDDRPEIHSGLVSLQSRVSNLVAYAEAFQQKVARAKRTVRVVKAASHRGVEEPMPDDAADDLLAETDDGLGPRSPDALDTLPA